MTLENNENINYEKLGIQTTTDRFKRYYEARLLDQVDESFIANLQDYWQAHYNKQIDPVLNIAFANLTGKKDCRVVPAKEMNHVFKPFFNDPTIAEGYRDKNIYDLLIKTSRAAETVLKCVRGNYFDAANNMLNHITARNKLLSYDSLMIKPSKTNNGVGVSKLVMTNDAVYLNDKEISFEDLEDIYDANYIVEEVIVQHPNMAEPHPHSVNTLRMLTLRWKNEIHYLFTYAKFGTNEEVRDNAGSGGVCIGVNDDGSFLTTAVDEYAMTYTHHPTTGYCFADLEPIPHFDAFKEFVKDAHKNIIHNDLVSWDIAVGTDGKPIFIEANFSGNTWLYQLAAQRPIFGDLTEDILEYVSHRTKKKIYLPNRQRIRKQQEEIQRQKEELDTYKHMVEQQKNELETYSEMINKKEHKKES